MTSERQEREQHEGLRGPVMASVSCHAMLLVASVAWGVFNPTIHLGSPDAGGGGGIVAVSSVPINVARSGEPNPVANPSRHSVPAPPQFRRSTELQPDPEEAPAAPVPGAPRREADQQQERAVGQRSAGEARENELRSSRGAALDSELYRAAPGSSLGFGGQAGGPFGTRFGWYAQILQRAIGEQWRRTLGQVRGGSSKPVVTSFVIHRDGRIDQVTIMQSSANRSLDYSAVRAITNANPVRPLPTGLRKRSVVIEMHFRLD